MVDESVSEHPKECDATSFPQKESEAGTRQQWLGDMIPIPYFESITSFPLSQNTNRVWKRDVKKNVP
jgi:hypothetical protein